MSVGVSFLSHMFYSAYDEKFVLGSRNGILSTSILFIKR